MGYDIYLVDPITKEVIILDKLHHMKGGTYAIGGFPEAHLNITYNYSDIYRNVFGDGEVELSGWDKMFGGGETGIRKIYGMSGAESTPFLQSAIEKLGDDVDSDYWKATEGNAKRSLIKLVTLAKMRPDGIWKGN
jgi:hypothetical protein